MIPISMRILSKLKMPHLKNFLVSVFLASFIFTTPLHAVAKNIYQTTSKTDIPSSRESVINKKCQSEKSFHLSGIIDSIRDWHSLQPAFFTDMGMIPNLPQTTVNAIMQDSDGIMWINVDNGLFRFDGLHIQLFRAQAHVPHSLPDSVIHTMRPHPQGGFLLGTATAGIIRFDPHTNFFDPVPSDAPAGRGLAVQAINSDNHSGFWIISDAGIGHLGPHDSTIHYEKLWPVAAGKKINRITDILNAKDGTLWLASGDGLFFRHTKETAFTRLHTASQDIENLLTSRITTLYQDRDDRLWVGSAFYGGLYITPSGEIYQPESLKASSSYINHRAIHGFAELPDNHIWIATMGGGIVDYAFWTAGTKGQLCAPQGEEYTGYVKTWTHNPLNTHSISGNNILSLMTDRDGGIWVATDRGVSRWDPHPSIAFNIPDVLVDKSGMISDSVTGLLSDEKGRIWIGLQNGMINIIDRHRTQIQKLSLTGLQVSQPVRAFLQAKDGAILAGSLGLARIDPKNLSVTSLMDDFLSKKTITALAETKYNLFIGTNSGLYIKDRATEKVSYFTHNADDSRSLISDHIKDIAIRSDNEVWIATANGISIHKNNVNGFDNILSHSENPRIFPRSFITSLAAKESTMLVGSFNGISQFSPNSRRGYDFQNFYHKDRPSADEINRLIVNKFGYIWASSSDGISVLDPARRQSFVLGERDHVSSGHFSQRTSALADDGSILFGGTNGLTVIAPEQILFSSSLPQNSKSGDLQVTMAEINEKPINFGQLPTLNQTFEVPPTARSLRIGFILLDYSAPRDVTYSYKLEGVDSQWITVPFNTPPIAIYTNLRSGHYALHIRAETSGLHAYSKEETFYFTIAPHWYEHWEISVVVVLIVLVGLYLIIILRTFLLKRQTKRLQNLVDNRTFELQQANQQLSALANTDVLTGLLNRRALMIELARIQQEAAEQNRTISLAMLDVDHFKNINDRYGHLVGDTVMRKAANIIRNNIRQNDFAGRYGGDEFVIAIAASLEISHNIAERIRHEFTTLIVKNNDTELKITVSIGLFEMKPDDNISVALDRADNMLYWAKNNGRNRVES